MTRIEELLMEKSKLEGERDHAVDQLALFKEEVCTRLYIRRPLHALLYVCGGSAALYTRTYMHGYTRSCPVLPDAGHH